MDKKYLDTRQLMIRTYFVGLFLLKLFNALLYRGVGHYYQEMRSINLARQVCALRKFIVDCKSILNLDLIDIDIHGLSKINILLGSLYQKKRVNKVTTHLKLSLYSLLHLIMTAR